MQELKPQKIIEKITNDLFEFSQYDERVLSELKEINVCINDENEENNPAYCMIDGNNKLHIPNKNLYTNEDNKN